MPSRSSTLHTGTQRGPTGYLTDYCLVNVLAPVTEPVEVTMPNGKKRICFDPHY